MLDGLWLVHFHVPATGNSRAGIILFQGTEAAGGDSTYYYAGASSIEDRCVSLALRIRKHSPGISVFGGRLTDFRLILQGKLAADNILCEGMLEHRELRLQAKLSRLPL